MTDWLETAIKAYQNEQPLPPLPEDDPSLEDFWSRKVELTIVWGGGAGLDRVKIYFDDWLSVLRGGFFQTSKYSRCEGERFRMTWTFKNLRLEVSGDDWQECWSGYCWEITNVSGPKKHKVDVAQVVMAAAAQNRAKPGSR